MQKASARPKPAVSAPTKTAVLNHLAIIPDGNSRWAKARSVSAFEGYRRGAKRGVEIARRVRELGIHTVTFWGLSTDNWRHRPPKELSFITKILVRSVESHLKEAIEHGVRIVHLGRKDRLPKVLLDKLAEAETKTRSNRRHVLNLALDYGGQDEIMRATKIIAKEAKAGQLDPEQLDKPFNGHEGKTVFDSYLDTGDQPYPNPDLVIRTSGEVRLSGILPWQGVYAELYFEPVYWPDFTKKKLDQALQVYRTRDRRFGGGH